MIAPPSLRKLVVVTLIAVAAMIPLVVFVDRPVAYFFWQLDQTAPEIVAMARFMTDLGKSHWYLTPLGTGAVLCFLLSRLGGTRARLYAQAAVNQAFLFSAIGISGLMVDGIKILVGRARPVLLREDGIFGLAPWSFESRWWSFPSGHANTMFALSFALMLLFPRWRWLFLTTGALVASTRVVVCAHYVSDVAASALLALLTTSLVATLRAHYETKRRQETAELMPSGV